MVKRPFDTWSVREEKKSVGEEVLLRADSTFHKFNCAASIEGVWWVKEDSLYLKFLTNEWRVDSLQKFGFEGRWPSLPKKPIKYHIAGKQLRRTEFYLNSDSVKYQVNFSIEKVKE